MATYLVNREDDDLCSLSELSQDVIFEAVRDRFEADIIYTNVSDMLIAVNPCKPLPALYSMEIARQYVQLTANRTPPHIFDVALRTYTQLKETQRPQCCIISGESGAGKTESTKLFVSHVLKLAMPDTDPLVAGPTPNGCTDLPLKINQVNPVLEAFGNAKTPLNDNSSRFGKYLQLQFDANGTISGATMSQYLLEKARVVHRSEGEENFHVFYYLVAGLPKDTAASLHLSPSDYHNFLYSDESSADDLSGTTTSFTKSLQLRFREMLDAMLAVGFSTAELQQIFESVAAIIHIGDIEFELDPGSDTAVVTSHGACHRVAKLLRVSEEQLQTALTFSVSVTRGEHIKRRKSVNGAEDCRNTLAKEVYSRLFEWIVIRINEQLSSSEHREDMTIGVLDIFGFENMPCNSFEQCCINLANEQLQFYFNENVFKWELAQYREEGIDVGLIEYTDNKPLLDFFLQRKVGLFDLLNQESFFPTATANSFSEKLNEAWGDSPIFEGNKIYKTCFVVKHFAGDIQYDSEQFLEKNRDPFPEDVREMLCESDSDFISSLFNHAFRVNTTSGVDQKFMKLQRQNSRIRAAMRAGSKDKLGAPGRGRRGKRNTLAASFKTSLEHLMRKMRACNPAFIRCIKPDQQRKPNSFVSTFVRRQLNYTGVFEAVRIRREGYPIRMPFGELVEQYGAVAFPLHRYRDMPATAANARRVMAKLNNPGWQLGKTRVFMKLHHLDMLRDLNASTMRAVIEAQKYVHGWLARARFKRLLTQARRERVQVEAFLSRIPQYCKARRITITDQEGERKHRQEVQRRMHMASEIAAMAALKMRQRKAFSTEVPGSEEDPALKGSQTVPRTASEPGGRVKKSSHLRRCNNGGGTAEDDDGDSDAGTPVRGRCITESNTQPTRMPNKADRPEHAHLRHHLRKSSRRRASRRDKRGEQQQQQQQQQQPSFRSNVQGINADSNAVPSVSSASSSGSLITNTSKRLSSSMEGDTAAARKYSNGDQTRSAGGRSFDSGYAGALDCDADNTAGKSSSLQQRADTALQHNRRRHLCRIKEQALEGDAHSDQWSQGSTGSQAFTPPPRHAVSPHGVKQGGTARGNSSLCQGADRRHSSHPHHHHRHERHRHHQRDGGGSGAVTEDVRDSFDYGRVLRHRRDSLEPKGHIAHHHGLPQQQQQQQHRVHSGRRHGSVQLQRRARRDECENGGARGRRLKDKAKPSSSSSSSAFSSPLPSSHQSSSSASLSSDDTARRDRRRSSRWGVSGRSVVSRLRAGISVRRRSSANDDLHSELTQAASRRASHRHVQRGASGDSLRSEVSEGPSYTRNRRPSLIASFTRRITRRSKDHSSKGIVLKQRRSSRRLSRRGTDLKPPLQKQQSFIEFLHQFEIDRTTLIPCVVEGCACRFSMFRDLKEHLYLDHLPVETKFLFHERTLAFLDTVGVLLSGQYYEGERVVQHFETRSSACKIDAREYHLAPRDIYHVNLQECENSHRSARTERIRQHIGSGVLVTVCDKSIYVTRSAKNPVYITTPIPANQQHLMLPGGELPRNETVCVFDYQLFRMNLHKTSPMECWEATQVRFRLVRDVPVSKGAAWVCLRATQAIQSWEKVHGVVFDDPQAQNQA